MVLFGPSKIGVRFIATYFLGFSPCPKVIPIGRRALSICAGAIKSYGLLTASIAEGALAALGEERNLGNRQGELFQRTFGRLLDAWKENNLPRSEVAIIWDDMQLLKSYRNAVHLNRAAEHVGGWQDILDNEKSILAAADRVIDSRADYICNQTTVNAEPMCVVGNSSSRDSRCSRRTCLKQPALEAP